MDEDKTHCPLDTFTEELARKWLSKWLEDNKPGYTYEHSNIDRGYLAIAINVPKKFEHRSDYIFNSESDPIMAITIDTISSKIAEYISDEDTDNFSFDTKIEFAALKDNKELMDAISDGIPGGISGLISNEINSVIDGYAIIVAHRLTDTHLIIDVYGRRTNQTDYVPKFTAKEMVRGIGDPQMAMGEPKVDDHENEEPAEPVKQEVLSLIGEEEEEKPFDKTIEDVCRECHVSKDAVKKHMMTHRVSLETAYKYYSSTTYAKRGTGTSVKVNGKFFATIGEACDRTGIPYYKVKKVHDETGLPYDECFEKLIDAENNVTEEELEYSTGGPAIPVTLSDGTKFASKTEMIKSLDVSYPTFLKWQRKEGWTDEEAYNAFKDGVVDGLRTPPGSNRKKGSCSQRWSCIRLCYLNAQVRQLHSRTAL